MKRTIGILLVVFLVLFSQGMASAASLDRPGRFQVTAQDEGRTILLDTATGNAWALSAKQIKGGISLRWVPIPFVETKGWPLPGESRPYGIEPGSLADEWPVHSP